MVKLLEKNVILKCLKSDVAFIKSVIQTAESNYTKLMKQETGQDFTTSIEIDENEFLEEKHKDW